MLPPLSKRFLLSFGTLAGLTYVLITSPYFMKTIFSAYLGTVSQATAFVLNLLGQHAAATGHLIQSGDFQIEIKYGCDGLDGILLFALASLSFPAPLLQKLSGMLGGAISLLLLNGIRIISLFFLGKYWPSMFHFAHVDLWPILYVLISLALWLGWAQWAWKRHDT